MSHYSRNFDFNARKSAWLNIKPKDTVGNEMMQLPRTPANT